MWVFFVIVGVIAAGIIAGVLIHKHTKKIKELQVKYVMDNSTKISKLKEINSRYVFLNPRPRELVYHYYLKSKRAFDDFDYDSAIRNTFFDKKIQIKSLMDKVTRDRNLLEKYRKEIKYLPETNIEALPKVKYMNNNLFISLENEYIQEKYLSVETEAAVAIYWSYESPAGRNFYEDHELLKYDEIVSAFFNYFNVDLRKVEENEKMELAVKNVNLELTKSVYRVSEVVDLFKKHNYDASETLAVSTLLKAGYIKRKDSNLYIHVSVKNIRDLILSSADENGLISYDNKIKDKDYDNAIEKLEKEGRIIPIDNLHFLKVCKTLNYCGITLDEIDVFESLLLKQSRKQLFISLKQIYESIDCLITNTDFEECFVHTIAKYCGFLFPVPGIEKLFTTIQKPQRIMFLEWLMKGKKSVDAFDLIHDLKEIYGVEYNIYSIMYDLEKNETELYYNPEMEKIYLKKEYFFEELEDVL